MTMNEFNEATSGFYELLHDGIALQLQETHRLLEEMHRTMQRQHEELKEYLGSIEGEVAAAAPRPGSPRR